MLLTVTGLTVKGHCESKLHPVPCFEAAFVWMVIPRVLRRLVKSLVMVVLRMLARVVVTVLMTEEIRSGVGAATAPLARAKA